MENESDTDVRAAFAAIDAGRLAAADRLVTPWWYHPALGLLLAGYLVAITAGSLLAMVIAMPVFFAGLFALVMSYKKRTGLWISGHRAGRATWWAIAMGVAVAACAFLGYSEMWPVWVMAVTAFIAVNLFGWLFDRTLRASLRNGSVVIE